jgi:2-desacetyl-2-hydroxyethyl bacteriochlorophyllide A dehydrogenase
MNRIGATVSGGVGVPARMQAAVLVAPRRFEVHSVPVPAVGPRQVLVRIEGCGVCGSSAPVWEGRPWFRYPLEPGAPGHEGWGRVVAAGPEVRRVAVGDRVACLNQRGFAEYDVADEDQVLVLPAALAGQDVPGEALACAWNVFRRGGIEAGQRVAVIGIGFLGALVTQLAARAGAVVWAISRREFAASVGRAMGAAESLVCGDDLDAVVRQIEARTEGRLCERVVEATGFQRPLDLASRLTAGRGRLVIAGYHQDGPRQVDMQLWNWRGIDVINAHERDPAVYLDGMRAAVEAVASGALEPRSLYTHRAELGRINEIFAALGDRPDGYLKGQVLA